MYIIKKFSANKRIDEANNTYLKAIDGALVKRKAMRAITVYNKIKEITFSKRVTREVYSGCLFEGRIHLINIETQVKYKDLLNNAKKINNVISVSV